jgi:hypothetical protein
MKGKDSSLLSHDDSRLWFKGREGASRKKEEIKDKTAINHEHLLNQDVYLHDWHAVPLIKEETNKKNQMNRKEKNMKRKQI